MFKVIREDLTLLSVMPPPTAPPSSKYLILSTPLTALATSMPYWRRWTQLGSGRCRSMLRPVYTENATARVSRMVHDVRLYAVLKKVFVITADFYELLKMRVIFYFINRIIILNIIFIY